MILLNQDAGFFDSMTTRNAMFVSENPYQILGADSSLTDRNSDLSFSFNFFRLGTRNGEFSNTQVQRRIVIVNGSTSELLFSLTPVGSTPDAVNDQIDSFEEVIFEAINSVTFTPTETSIPVEISVGNVSVDGSNFVIDFSSPAGEAGFRIMTSDLESEEFVDDVTSLAAVTEVTPGNYQAIIDISSLGNSAFFRIEL